MTDQSRIWEHLHCCYYVDLRYCWSEMLSITMRAVAQNLFQDTYTGKWRLAQNMLWALKQKTIQYSWQKYVKCPFSKTLNKCGIAISDPSTLCRYHSEVRQEAVQQALAAMNDKPKQVGRIIHNILMVADTNVHKTRKNIFTFFYLSVILNFCPSDFYFPVDADVFQDMIKWKCRWWQQRRLQRRWWWLLIASWCQCLPRELASPSQDSLLLTRLPAFAWNIIISISSGSPTWLSNQSLIVVNPCKWLTAV